MKNRIALSLLALSFLTVASSYVLAQESSQSNRKVMEKVMPSYPSLARTMNIVGTVRADVTVAPNGNVKLVELRGHPVLGQAAQDALQHWKWAPASRETHESVEFKFNP